MKIEVPHWAEMGFDSTLKKARLPEFKLHHAARYVRSLLQSGIHVDYEIQRTEFGKGQFGVVKQAIHRETGKPAAVKILAKRDDSGKSDEAWIWREVNVMREVDHPNCIELYGCYESKTHVYIVMEPVTGGQLLERIVAKDMYSETEAAACFLQIIGAINYLHQIGIVHRDIKPDNILYASPADNAPIKLCDFGLSKIVNIKDLDSRKFRLWSRCGSPDYVAPEILLKQGYGKECDIWSAGTLLYVLLCGFPPFSQSDLHVKFDNIRKGKFSFPEGEHISAEAKDLVRKMMCVDATARLTCTQILEHPWVTAYLDGQLSKEAMPQMQSNLKETTIARRLLMAVKTITAISRMTHPPRIPSRAGATQCLDQVHADPHLEAELRECFSILDIGAKGFIAPEDLVSASHSVRRPIAQEAAKEVLLAFDVMDRGRFGFEEFCILMCAPQPAIVRLGSAFNLSLTQLLGSPPPSPKVQPAPSTQPVEHQSTFLKRCSTTMSEAELRETYAAMDIYRDGVIKADDLKEILSSFGHAISDEEAKDMIKVLDRKGSGAIDYDDFLALFSSMAVDSPSASPFCLSPADTKAKSSTTRPTKLSHHDESEEDLELGTSFEHTERVRKALAI